VARRSLIIDADSFAFRAASAAQHGIAWDDDIYTLHADMKEAKVIFVESIECLREAIGPETDVILAYSCPTRRYFRHDLLPTYKGNRKGSISPLCYKDLKTWSESEYKVKVKPGLEADDIVGILATDPNIIKGEKIVVSIDKDLYQIPGLYLDPNDLDSGVFRISKEFSERYLWKQVLTGDSVDNYTGLPGIGPKRAEGILDGAKGDYAEAVLKAYLKAGLTAEDMAIQYNVARILTTHDYDFKQEKPILWQPV
jgi:DNA polymerase I